MNCEYLRGLICVFGNLKVLNLSFFKPSVLAMHDLNIELGYHCLFCSSKKGMKSITHLQAFTIGEV